MSKSSEHMSTSGPRAKRQRSIRDQDGSTDTESSASSLRLAKQPCKAKYLSGRPLCTPRMPLNQSVPSVPDPSGVDAGNDVSLTRDAVPNRRSLAPLPLRPSSHGHQQLNLGLPGHEQNPPEPINEWERTPIQATNNSKPEELVTPDTPVRNLPRTPGQELVCTPTQHSNTPDHEELVPCHPLRCQCSQWTCGNNNN